MKSLIYYLPYLASLTLGSAIFLLTSKTEGALSDLALNIAASFFSIPLIFLFFESVKAFSERRLNRVIHNHVKLRIMQEQWSILNQLQKYIYTYDQLTESKTNPFEIIDKNVIDIRSLLERNQYLGFQIFKHWDISISNLNDILKNPFFLKHLPDDFVITMLEVIQHLNSLESTRSKRHMYVDTGVSEEKYRCVSGKEMGPENTSFPNRFLLLENLKDNQYLVKDFGDLPIGILDKATRVYSLEESELDSYSAIIFSTKQSVVQLLKKCEISK